MIHNLKLDETFVTSDHHFYHGNVIKHSNRPFDNVDQMNEHMIEMWNSVVKKNNTVFYLGDMILLDHKNKIDSLLSRLNGKIILIKGNHDPKKLIRHSRFLSVNDYLEITVENHNFVLMHYPLARWNKGHYGTIQLHGHAHGTFGPITKRQVDVGVDSLGYVPFNLKQIIDHIKENNCWELKKS